MVNYFRGHVQVRIDGAFPERFLNICSQNSISFWALERISPSSLKAMMHISDFKRIRRYAKRSMCRVKLIKKVGVPFFLWRFRRRYALYAGLAMFILIVYAFSLFVWDIEVTGAQTVPYEKILYSLSQNGVKIGTYTPDIDYETTKNKLLLDISELSWVTINVKGSRAIVEVRERIPVPVIIPRNMPCNVVAARAGVITGIDVLAGSPQVAAGQTVVKGQLLVSGIIDSEKVGARFVHAMADVTARTWSTLYSVMPLQHQTKQYTGQTKVRRALIFGGNRVNLYFNTSKPFDTYDKITEKTQLRLLKNIVLPLVYVKEEYRAYEAVSYELSEKEAEAMLRESLDKRAGLTIGEGKIESKQVNSRTRAGLAGVEMTIEAEEQIALTKEIPASAYAALQ